MKLGENSSKGFGDIIKGKIENSSKGFGGKIEIPKPNIINVGMGKPKNPNVERMMMMYTCKLCEGRNAQMVSFSHSRFSRCSPTSFSHCSLLFCHMHICHIPT
jgi:hypothetical protein